MKPQLPEGGYFNLAVARDEAVKKLSLYDPRLLARNAAVDFSEENRSLAIPFLHRLYHLSYPGGTIYDDEGKEAPVYQSILLLHYLVTADGTPLSGEWISYRHLPGGEIHGALPSPRRSSLFTGLRGRSAVFCRRRRRHRRPAQPRKRCEHGDPGFSPGTIKAHPVARRRGAARFSGDSVRCTGALVPAHRRLRPSAGPGDRGHAETLRRIAPGGEP